MTRIALVPSSYLPALGGVEEFTRHLARGLLAAGDDVEIWTGRTGAHSGQTEQLEGVTIRRFAFDMPSARPSALARFPFARHSTVAALDAAVSEFAPEVVNVHCFGPNGFYSTTLARRHRLPLVVSLHGETLMDDHDIFEHSVVLRTALRSALRSADEITACSKFALDDAHRRFGLQPDRGLVVFNGVDLSADGSRSSDFSAPPGVNRYVLCVGRLVWKKGFDLLLHSFVEIATKQPTVDVLIGGSGDQLSSLQSLATGLGLGGRVHFLGRLSREQVASAMTNAAVVVVPSRLEPFGIVVLEAWRAGAAVIATSVGGPAEFVRNGEDGLLVDCSNPAALADCLDRVLTDEDFASSLGHAAQIRVQGFGWERVTEEFRSIYRRSLDGHR